MFVIKIKNCFVCGFGINGNTLTLTGIESNAKLFGTLEIEAGGVRRKLADAGFMFDYSIIKPGQSVKKKPSKRKKSKP